MAQSLARNPGFVFRVNAARWMQVAPPASLIYHFVVFPQPVFTKTHSGWTILHNHTEMSLNHAGFDARLIFIRSLLGGRYQIHVGCVQGN